MIRRLFKKLVGPGKPDSSPSSKSPASAGGKSRSGGKPGTVSNRPDLKAKSPEVICGIDKSMGKEEIRDRLAELYRRHNRAAGSLDEELRAEAEQMLEAIVVCREKYVDGK